jgi:hypothetical protein
LITFTAILPVSGGANGRLVVRALRADIDESAWSTLYSYDG